MMRMFLMSLLKYKYNFVKMKYLKRYNESLEGVETELRDFCETNLAYLIDDYFEIGVSGIRPKRLNYFSISISNTGFFKWNDIKDQVLPFLIRISKKYKVINLVEFYFREGKGDKQEPTRDIYISLEDILNDAGDMELVSKEGSVILGMWTKIKV